MIIRRPRTGVKNVQIAARAVCCKAAGAAMTGNGSLVTGLVFRAAQTTVVVGVAPGKVLAEPCIVPDIRRGQAALVLLIQSAEIRTARIGLFHCTAFCGAIRAHHVIAVGRILSGGRWCRAGINFRGLGRGIQIVPVAGAAGGG